MAENAILRALFVIVPLSISFLFPNFPFTLGRWVTHLLAPQSGALRRGAYRDFYPIPYTHPKMGNNGQQWTPIRGAACISDAVSLDVLIMANRAAS